METNYWKSSPFGVESIFHPSWEEKERNDRNHLLSNVRILDVYISQAKPNYKEQYIPQDNLSLERYTPASIRLDFQTVYISVFVIVSGHAEAIYITVNNQCKRAIDHERTFEVKISKSSAKETIKVKVALTDFMGEEVFDEKEYLVAIDSGGNVSEKNVIEYNKEKYSVVDGYVQGNNVITHRSDNHVKPSGLLQRPVLAIVLHRTVGSSISGAISHSKGTHFYIEGDRNPEKDGEIFQAMSLKNCSSHIFNDTARISHFEVKTNNSIGIEVVGLAYYKKNGILYQNFGEKKVITNIPPLTKAYVDKNGIENYWDPLTEAQIKSTVNIVKLLMKEYSIPPSMILTHEEIQSKTAGEGQAVKDAIFDYLI